MTEDHFVLNFGHICNMESLVTDIVTYVLIRFFHIIAQHSEGVHYFHRVVGLVV